MENLNLAPIEKLLTTGIKPRELVKVLDEILFDYIQAIINLHLKTEGEEDVIHSETGNYIFCIRELRDVFGKCVE